MSLDSKLQIIVCFQHSFKEYHYLLFTVPTHQYSLIFLFYPQNNNPCNNQNITIHEQLSHTSLTLHSNRSQVNNTQCAMSTIPVMHCEYIVFPTCFKGFTTSALFCSGANYFSSEFVTVLLCLGIGEKH